MALSGLSSVVTSKYRNLVGDYEIAYDVKQNTGEKADKVLGSIKSISETCIVDTSAIIEDISGTVKSE